MAKFERNQRLISDNANRKSNMGRGSIRRGEALLAGLFRCARCGRKLTVSYSGKGGPTQRYVAAAPPTRWLPAVASRSGAFGLIALSPKRFWIDCNHLASRLP